MPDYPYDVEFRFPFTEEIRFNTDIIPYDTLSHAVVGSASAIAFSTSNATPVNMPRPMYRLITEQRYKSVVSSDFIPNPREQRKIRYEAKTRTYNLMFRGMTTTEVGVLKQFYIDRKGRFNNFNFKHPDMFGGTETLVRWSEDTLQVQCLGYKQFQAVIPVSEALNGTYMPFYNVPYRRFHISYRTSSLATIFTFFDTTTTGRVTTFTFNPSSIASWLDNTDYTCRLDLTALKEQWRQTNDKTMTVTIEEVI